MYSRLALILLAICFLCACRLESAVNACPKFEQPSGSDDRSLSPNKFFQEVTECIYLRHDPVRASRLIDFYKSKGADYQFQIAKLQKLVLPVKPVPLSIEQKYRKVIQNCTKASKTEQIYEQIVSDYPDCEYSWISLGLEYSMHDRPKEALRAFQKATRIAPNNLIAHVNLMGLYEITRNRTSLLREIDILISLVPEQKIYAELRDWYKNGGDWLMR